MLFITEHLKGSIANKVTPRHATLVAIVIAHNKAKPTTATRKWYENKINKSVTKETLEEKSRVTQKS